MARISWFVWPLRKTPTLSQGVGYEQEPAKGRSHSADDNDILRPTSWLLLRSHSVSIIPKPYCLPCIHITVAEIKLFNSDPDFCRPRRILPSAWKVRPNPNKYNMGHKMHHKRKSIFQMDPTDTTSQKYDMNKSAATIERSRLSS